MFGAFYCGDDMEMKRCTDCGIEKPFSDFYCSKSTRCGVVNFCKSCAVFRRRKCNLKNAVTVKESKDKWIRNNPEKRRLSAVEYMRRVRKKNKGKREKLNHFISCRIRDSLKKGAKGRKHWEEFVDFTLEQLKKHLEKKFLPGMTWENHGINGWHIDHKIPQSAFNFSTPQDNQCGEQITYENMISFLNLFNHL
jgi:hypothetical protein